VFPHILIFLLAAPTLVGRVADSSGKPVRDATVRIQEEGGRAAETLTDSRGAFRLEVSGRFRLEIHHPSYRTVRSSTASITGASGDDVYQADVSLLPGNPDDVETVELQLE